MDLLLGIVLCAVAAVWSCGEEHRDEQDAGAEVIDAYRFSLEASREAPFLTFSQTVDGRRRLVEVRSPDVGRFTGTYAPDSGEIVLEEGAVLDIATTDFWDDTPRDMTFLARDDIEIPRGFPATRNVFPTFGTFTLADAADTVTGIFTDRSGERGVDLSINGTQATFFREAAFTGLFGVEADVRQQEASLAFIIVDLLVEQVFFTAQTVSIIREREQTLEDEGMAVFSCEDFSLMSGSGPLPEAGSRTLTFFDTDADGEVGPGDSFRWDLISCWEGERIGLVEGMVDGRVDFTDLVEETRDDSDVLTRFGFSRGDGTGVQYTDFVYTQVQEESGTFAFDAGRIFTINGGFDIVFSETDHEEQ